MGLVQVCIFDNDKDDGLLVIQEAAAEAMATAVYDGHEACVRVRLLMHAAPGALTPYAFMPAGMH